MLTTAELGIWNDVLATAELGVGSGVSGRHCSAKYIELMMYWPLISKEWGMVYWSLVNQGLKMMYRALVSWGWEWCTFIT